MGLFEDEDIRDIIQLIVKDIKLAGKHTLPSTNPSSKERNDTKVGKPSIEEQKKRDPFYKFTQKEVRI